MVVEDYSFTISFPSAPDNSLLTGRVLILLAAEDDVEPRFQIADSPGTQIVFGMDIENMPSDSLVRFGSIARGYPLDHINDVYTLDDLFCPLSAKKNDRSLHQKAST